MSNLIRLNDRLFATTLDSLAIVRDELRAKGLTGDDCQAALDLLQSGVTPSTDGIEFRFVDTAQTPPPSRNFQAFCDGYIEAALWADCMPSDDDREGETGGREHLVPRPGARERMIERGQLFDFYQDNLSKLAHYAVIRGAAGSEEREAFEWAGHDFWLTRNGHGAGFWDRGMGPTGDALTEACKPYGSADDHTPFDCGDGSFDV